MNVTSLPTEGTRAASRLRVRRVREARGRLHPRSTGRAWINGREVGGNDARFTHLTRSFD